MLISIRRAAIGLVVLIALTSVSNRIQAQQDSGPRFEGKTTLLRPTGYREWVFVGSSLGLRYDPTTEEKPQPRPEIYHNVYINPSSYREFAKTGKFPDGTMMVLELARSAVKKEPGLQGSFQDKFFALEASVKDSSRFEEAWAYFSFDDKDGKLKSKATPFPKTACWSCHDKKAETDFVFTQFYPVLREIAPK